LYVASLAAQMASSPFLPSDVAEDGDYQKSSTNEFQKKPLELL
jgi:hypothetical protein